MLGKDKAKLLEEQVRVGMDAFDFPGDRLEVEIPLRELARTIRYACIRCLTPSEIIKLVCDLNEAGNLGDYIGRLLELGLTADQFECLARGMEELASRSESVPSSVRVKIDRTILRLVRILPSHLACRFAEPYVDHPRKARREWAYTALREKEVSLEIALKLVDIFKETQDQRALELIARNPKCVVEVGIVFLLKNIREEYWRARVLESALRYDRANAVALSREYPFEFTHAVGRLGDPALLSSLCPLLGLNAKDPKFLAIYAYALGKIGARDELESLDRFVRSRAESVPVMAGVA